MTGSMIGLRCGIALALLGAARAGATTLFSDTFASGGSGQGGTLSPLTWTGYGANGGTTADTGTPLTMSSANADTGVGLDKNFAGTGATGSLFISYDFTLPAPTSRWLQFTITEQEVTSSGIEGGYYNNAAAYQNGLLFYANHSNAEQVQANGTTENTYTASSTVPNTTDTYHANISYNMSTGAFTYSVTDSTTSTLLGTTSGTANVFDPSKVYLGFATHNQNATVSNFIVSDVPEPASLGVMLLGGLGLLARRKRA